METVEIYWNDLSLEKQQELIEAGLTDDNVLEGIFPVATLLVGGGTI
jgi:hypothetical protein